jgi:hypothetical protein
VDTRSGHKTPSGNDPGSKISAGGRVKRGRQKDPTGGNGSLGKEERGEPNKQMTIDETLKFVIEKLETQGFEYAIGGSFASSAWGQPRQTNDLDLVLKLSESDAPRFVATFENEFAVGTSALEEALHSRGEHRGFHLMEFDSAFQVDIFLFNGTPFDDSEFARRQRTDILPGIQAWVFSAEDTVLRKLQWYELGNRKSDKQWNDVMRIIEVQAERLDNEYLNNWASHLGLQQLVSEARREIKAST